MEISEKTRSLAVGNDLFRQSFKKEKIVITEGVDNSADRSEIIEATRSFKDFTEANDPNGEHNFGAFKVKGKEYFWKIDYYDSNFDYGADPYESSIFERVLTVMRAEEY